MRAPAEIKFRRLKMGKFNKKPSVFLPERLARASEKC